MSEFKNSFKAFVVAVVLGTAATALVWAQQRPDAGSAQGLVAGPTAVRNLSTDASLTLAPDQAGAAGDIRITYRGMVEPHRLRIDVTIPALDPFYAYPHTIDVAAAREGFILAGHRFELLSLNRSRIRLKWTGPRQG